MNIHFTTKSVLYLSNQTKTSKILKKKNNKFLRSEYFEKIASIVLEVT